jgi:hypothetical protein
MEFRIDCDKCGKEYVFVRVDADIPLDFPVKLAAIFDYLTKQTNNKSWCYKCSSMQGIKKSGKTSLIQFKKDINNFLEEESGEVRLFRKGDILRVKEDVAKEYVKNKLAVILEED